MKMWKKVKAGITLIELIIVLALMSIITVLVFNFFSLSQKKGSELDVKQELQHNGNMISESMMKYILECESIDSIIPKVSNSNDKSINSVFFKFDKLKKLESNPVINDIEKIEYRLEGNKLNIYFWKKDAASGIRIQTVSNNIESMKIENKKILDEIKLGQNIDSTVITELIKKETGIKLEITLKKKGITHTHTCELNLRNSN